LQEASTGWCVVRVVAGGATKGVCGYKPVGQWSRGAGGGRGAAAAAPGPRVRRGDPGGPEQAGATPAH
jgi:hypothetical protein